MATIFHLETLAGIAKGLTRTVDGMILLEDETDPSYQAEACKIKQAREDARILTLRNNIFSVIKGVVELWSADAAIAQVLFFLTHPFSMTLISFTDFK